MRIQRLDEDMYDVAVFGYLQAVKKWFARPDLQRWSFKTVVHQAVRGSIGNERKRQGKQIQTISLDDVIPGTDGLTYRDTVTDENIRYLTGEKEIKGMKINFGVKIPEAARLSRTPSVEIETVLEFLASPHKTMSLGYDNKKQAAGKVSTLRGWKKKENRTDFNIYRIAETIYIEKTPAKSKRGEK